MTTTVIAAPTPNIMVMITLVQLQLTFFIPEVDQDAARLEFVVKEERSKRERNVV